MEQPSMILKNKYMEVWTKIDRTYAVPKGSFKILLQSPNTFRSAKEAIGVKNHINK